jgi:hypothetical protein
MELLLLPDCRLLATKYSLCVESSLVIVSDRVPNKSADSISRVSDCVHVHVYIPEQLKVNDLLYLTIKVEYDYNNKYIVTTCLL